MSTTQPPSPQTPSSIDPEKLRKTAHTVALAALIACPVLALLPPRKLDIYTIGLIVTTGYSANHLIRESSGRSIYQHVTRQPAVQMAGQASGIGGLQKQARGEEEDGGLLYKEGWKARRRREIRDDVEEGKGVGDMIVEQVWEVWNQGRKKTEGEEEDEG